MPIKNFVEQNKNWLIIALLIFVAGAAFSGLPT